MSRLMLRFNCLFLVACGSSVAGAQITSRVSVDDSGMGGNDSSIGTPSISWDGRYVAFESDATNLVQGDTNDSRDVFVRDRLLQTIVRLSVDSSGVEGDGDSRSPVISKEGRYVAFSSEAENLVPNDMGHSDVFVHDRLTGVTRRVSVDSFGVQANGSSGKPSISQSGFQVAFISSASNLVTGDTNLEPDVFVHDWPSGATVRASVGVNGNEGNGECRVVALSGDGRSVAFDSLSDNIVDSPDIDTNGVRDIFVKLLSAGNVVRVSKSSSGAEADDFCYDPAMSHDGTIIAFATGSTNLVPGDTNNRFDVFVHDLRTSETTRVSVATGGIESHGFSDYPMLSDNGRYVGFYSIASDLVSGDTNGRFDSFLHDRVLVETTRASVNSLGQEASGGGSACDVSGDGRHVAFLSNSDDLVPSDTNDKYDSFVHGSELTLDVQPTTVAPGQVLTLKAYSGVPSHLASLWITAINQTPVFTLVSIGAFGAGGIWTVSSVIPPGSPAVNVEFLGLGLGWRGVSTQTNRRVVDFR